MKKNKNKPISNKLKVSRKQALKNIGFGAFTAATMMLLLNNPRAHAAASADKDQGGGLDDWNPYQ